MKCEKNMKWQGIHNCLPNKENVLPGVGLEPTPTIMDQNALTFAHDEQV